MTHCGTFHFDDLLVSCATEIVENGFESKLIPEVIKSWICEKIVQSLPLALVKELLKGLLESRNYEKTINYSNDVIKDASGFEIGMDIRMKVFKNDAIKSWYENTIEKSESGNLNPKNPDSDKKIRDSSEIFDKKQNFIETPFFCNEIITDSYQEIPLKNLKIFDYRKKTRTFDNLDGKNSTSRLPHENGLPKDSLPNDGLPSLTHPQKRFPQKLFTPNPPPKITEKQKVNCVFCGQVYAQKNSLRKHYKKAHPEEYEIMPKLRKPFDKFTDLLECIKCEYIATSKSTLDAHQRKNHPEYRDSIKEKIRYKHDKPSYNPQHSNDDSLHSSDSSDDEYRTCVYKCQICKNNFKTEQELNSHQQKNHTEYYRMKQTSKQARLDEFKCKICEKQFTRKQALQQHMFTHTGDHPYKCDVCGQGFSDAWMVKRHMKSHDKIGVKLKTYECEVCGQAFSGNWMVKRHMKTHDKIK